MKKLRAIPLGDEGRQYLIGRLKDGHELSAELLRCVDLQDGEVSTPLPETTSDHSARNFDRGGKVLPQREERINRGSDSVIVEVPNTSEDFAKEVNEYLS